MSLIDSEPQTLYGMKVVVSPDIPKMKLAPGDKLQAGDYVTSEYRKEIDEWLLGFFGTINPVADGTCMVSDVLGTIWVNPKTYTVLRGQQGAFK